MVVFEKCGLRDIFVRIKKLLWLIVILAVIGAALGSVLYLRDLKAYEASVAEKASNKQTMYCGFATFYMDVNVSGADTTAKVRSSAAFSYKTMFSNSVSSNMIYRRLTENHDAEELKKRLNSERFSEDGSFSRYNLYGEIYGIRSVAGNAVFEVRVCAEDKAMCKELLEACRKRLLNISSTMPEFPMTFEGKTIRKRSINVDSFFEKTKVVSPAQMENSTEQQQQQQEEEDAAPGMTNIIVFALAGLLAGIVIAIALAIFLPSINRDSDFELYGIRSLGTVQKSGAEVLARVILKMRGPDASGKIVIASSMAGNKKIREFYGLLKDNLEKYSAADGDGRKVETALAEQPFNSAEASMVCEEGGMIIALEKRGVSGHYKFDAMKHYLQIMDKEIEGAVLLA